MQQFSLSLFDSIIPDKLQKRNKLFCSIYAHFCFLFFIKNHWPSFLKTSDALQMCKYQKLILTPRTFANGRVRTQMDYRRLEKYLMVRTI